MLTGSEVGHDAADERAVNAAATADENDDVFRHDRLHRSPVVAKSGEPHEFRRVTRCEEPLVEGVADDLAAVVRSRRIADLRIHPHDLGDDVGDHCSGVVTHGVGTEFLSRRGSSLAMGRLWRMRLRGATPRSTRPRGTSEGSA